MRKAYIVHGWYGSVNEPLLKWINQQLEEKGYQSDLLEMPDAENPQIKTWVDKLKDAVELGKDTLLIGHSIGAQAIMRFLEELPDGEKIGRVIFIAPWFYLTNWEDVTQAEIETMTPWLTIPIDLEKVKTKADEWITIFSDNDEFVPLKKNSEKFRKSLGAEVIIEEGKGHFTEDNGVVDLPILLNII